MQQTSHQWACIMGPVKAAWLVLLVGLFTFSAEIVRRFEERPAQGAVFGTWMGGDGIAYRATVRGFVDQATMDPARAFPEGEKYNPLVSRNLRVQDSNRARREDGGFLPSRSMLMPVVLIPFYGLFRERGLLLFNLVQCLLLLWLVLRFHQHFFEDAIAVFASLAWLADGILDNYAYNVSPDVFGCVLMLGGLLLCWKKDARREALWAGGTLMALSLWLRPSNAFIGVALLPAALEAWRTKRWTPALVHPLLAMTLVMLLWAALNLLWFGNPLTPAYEHMATIQDGIPTTEAHSTRFSRPFWDSLLPTFFDRGAGFFSTAPHWPLFAVLLFWWGRRQPVPAVVAAVLTFAPVLLLVKYDYWNASSYGNRFMLLPSAVSSVVFGVVAQWVLQRPGVLGQGAGGLTDPRLEGPTRPHPVPPAPPGPQA